MSIRLLSAAALALAAGAAFAQSPPGAEKQGLSDLNSTVERLDEQAEPAPAEAAPAPAPAAPVPARARPAAPAPAQASAAPLSAAETAEIVRAAARGRQLAAVARAGMIATQDMLARVPNPESAGIDGWIAEEEGAATTVTFFDNQADGPKTVYRVTILGGRATGRDTFLASYRPPLTRSQARLAAARTAAAGIEAEACGGSEFNYFVLPPASAAGPVEVYRISAQAARGRFPAGGHYRYRVAANGEIADSHAFASSCSQFEVGEPVAGQTPQPVAISGQADALPTEAQVLLSQMSGRALVYSAGTPARQWLVAGERIAEIRDGRPSFVTPSN